MITKQEIEYANSIDIASFLKTRGMSAKRVGSAYEWQAPTGKVTIKGCKWYSHYERVGGYTIDFVKKYFELDFKEAMEELLGKRYTSVRDKSIRTQIPFRVPRVYENSKRVFNYLHYDRCINKEVINAFMREGLIFEDAKYHSAVFVGKDSEGKIKHLHKRAISSSSFKGNVESSNPDYSFNWIGNSNKLFIYEAPIDMLSYISIYSVNWKNDSHVALCSTAPLAAIRILKEHPEIDTVFLCLDHDSAGIEGSYRIAEELHALGKYGVWRIQPDYKDWNEDVKSMHGKDAIPSSESPRLEYIKAECQSIADEDFEMYGCFEKKEFIFGMKTILFKIGENHKEYDEETVILFNQMSRLALGLYCKERGESASSVASKLQELYKPHRDYMHMKGRYKELADSIGKLEGDTSLLLPFALNTIAMCGAIERRLEEQKQNNNISIGAL